MVNDGDKLKDLTVYEDEDLPDFIFAHDLLGEDREEEEMEEDLSLNNGFDELLTEGDTGEVRDPRAEEAPGEGTQDTGGAAEEVLDTLSLTKEIATEEEAAPSISEEKIDAFLTKIVIHVLERATRAIIFDVAEKVINEEIDTPKNSITSLD